MKKLNTKNCCFLCLQSNKIKSEDHYKNSGPSYLPIRQKRNLLRCLMRHLKINLSGFETVPSNSFISNQDVTDVEVDLCEDCAKMNSRFSKLFLQLEKIQMEMDFSLGSIHHRILESSENEELVQNYSMEMTSDQETWTQLAFVDKLRIQIADKSLREPSINPKVYLTPTELAKVIIVKQETDEIEDFGSNDHFKEGDPNRPILEVSQDQAHISLPPELTPEETSSKVKRCCANKLSTGKYDCTIGRKSFKRSNSVRVHFKAVRLNKTFNCDGCKRPFSRYDYLTKHKMACKRKVFARNKKKNVYYTKDKVTGTFKCTKCEKKSSDSRTIVTHYETIHLKKRYKCDICNVKEFPYPNSLKYHKEKCKTTLGDLIIKNKMAQNVCKLCGKGFPRKERLVAHTRRVHRNADRYACDLCEKKFKASENLKLHRDKTHFGKRFECRFCRKICRNKYLQKYHERDCSRKNVKIERKD